MLVNERKQFIIKVYSICGCQILISTLLTVAAFMTPLGEWMKKHTWLHLVAMVVGICLFCIIACFKEASRKVPQNYILLFTFTFVWSYMVAGFCSWYNPESVLAAATMTTVMFVGLTAYACCAKDEELEYCWAAGAVLSFLLLPAILFAILFGAYTFFYVLVIVLCSIYIVYDTKIIMKDLEPDEYIIGALILYVDLINLFLYILSLFGGSSD